MYNWFSTMPGMLCAQVLVMQEGELYTEAARRKLYSEPTAYSSGVLEVAVLENGSGIRYSMGELSG